MSLRNPFLLSSSCFGADSFQTSLFDEFEPVKEDYYGTLSIGNDFAANSSMKNNRINSVSNMSTTTDCSSQPISGPGTPISSESSGMSLPETYGVSTPGPMFDIYQGDQISNQVAPIQISNQTFTSEIDTVVAKGGKTGKRVPKDPKLIDPGCTLMIKGLPREMTLKELQRILGLLSLGTQYYIFLYVPQACLFGIRSSRGYAVLHCRKTSYVKRFEQHLSGYFQLEVSRVQGFRACYDAFYKNHHGFAAALRAKADNYEYKHQKPVKKTPGAKRSSKSSSEKLPPTQNRLSSTQVDEDDKEDENVDISTSARENSSSNRSRARDAAAEWTGSIYGETLYGDFSADANVETAMLEKHLAQLSKGMDFNKRSRSAQRSSSTSMEICETDEVQMGKGMVPSILSMLDDEEGNSDVEIEKVTLQDEIHIDDLEYRKLKWCLKIENGRAKAAIKRAGIAKRKAVRHEKMLERKRLLAEKRERKSVIKTV